MGGGRGPGGRGNPEDVQRLGVVVRKASPDLMMVVHLVSPDKSRDSLFISNYATLEIKDALTRVDGVGSITVFGSRDYSMRVWLDCGIWRTRLLSRSAMMRASVSRGCS